MARAGRGRALIEFDPRATQRSITIAARNAKGQFTKIQGAVLRTNRRSVQWLVPEAVKNLDQAISGHGRPQDHNSGRLRRAIEDPASHEATIDGFRFMRDDVVREKVPYYRAIERGSDYWVGKQLPFMFLGADGGTSANNPSRRRDPVNSRGRLNEHLVGPRQYRAMGSGGDRHLVTIRNPVPRYAYASKARRTFLAGGIYSKFLLEEAREFEQATGAKVTVS